MDPTPTTSSNTWQHQKVRLQGMFILACLAILVVIAIFFLIGPYEWFAHDNAHIGWRGPTGTGQPGQPCPFAERATTSEPNITTAHAMDAVSQNVREAVSISDACRTWYIYNGPTSWFGDDAISNFIENFFQLISRWLEEAYGPYWYDAPIRVWNSFFADQTHCVLILSFFGLVYAALLKWCIEGGMKWLHDNLWKDPNG